LRETKSYFNTAIGYNAGSNLSKYNNIDGSYNTFIGAGSNTDQGGSYSYSTAIGYNSIITGSNQIVLGTSAETIYFNKGSSTPVGGITYNPISIGMDVSGVHQTLNNPNNYSGYIKFFDGSKQYTAKEYFTLDTTGFSSATLYPINMYKNVELIGSWDISSDNKILYLGVGGGGSYKSIDLLAPFSFTIWNFTNKAFILVSLSKDMYYNSSTNLRNNYTTIIINPIFSTNTTSNNTAHILWNGTYFLVKTQ
jgi:hypothetical protein